MSNETRAPEGCLGYIPWEPTTFIFRGYNLYIRYNPCIFRVYGIQPSFLMVLGSKGRKLYYPAMGGL